MSYSAMAHRLLVSAPGDIPASDLHVVQTRVLNWNATYGETFNAAIVPIHWRTNSSATHGTRPQATLNAQLVDRADAVLVLLWHRLGTPTGEADSGTIEELERATASGRTVGVLRCTRALPHDVDTRQLARLRSWLQEHRGDSLVLEYDSEADLDRHVEQFLSRMVTQRQTEGRLTTAPRLAADVWPHVRTADVARTGPRGDIRFDREYRLVLHNAGTAPARNVRALLELEAGADGQLPGIDLQDVEVLPPSGEVGFLVHVAFGDAPQARCVVDWVDDGGEHQNVATVRFF